MSFKGYSWTQLTKVGLLSADRCLFGGTESRGAQTWPCHGQSYIKHQLHGKQLVILMTERRTRINNLELKS